MSLLPITRALLERAIDYQMIVHPPARNAREMAEALDTDIYDILKVVPIATRGHLAYGIVRGHDSLDMARVRRALDDRDARPATAAEVERAWRGIDAGCLPPIDPAGEAVSLVDPTTFGSSDVIFATGRAGLSVKAAAADLFAGPNVHVVTIRQRAPWEETIDLRPGLQKV